MISGAILRIILILLMVVGMIAELVVSMRVLLIHIVAMIVASVSTAATGHCQQRGKGKRCQECCCQNCFPFHVLSPLLNVPDGTLPERRKTCTIVPLVK